MPEEKDPVADPAKTGDEGTKPKTMTLEEVTSQIGEIKSENEKIKKQNSDKDAFISKVTGENKELRETLQRLSGALSGKTDKQKDAFLDGQKQKFLDKGYDAESVDLILDTISATADKIADKKIASVIMDATEGLVESDPEINKDFMEKNSDMIKAEFDSYKPESSPRKIKANLKKAYDAVKARLADKAKGEGKGEDGRDEMLEGGKPPAKPKKSDKDSEKEFVEGIVNAGGTGGHFI